MYIYIYVRIIWIWNPTAFGKRQVSCAVCAVCSDRGISRPSRRVGDEEGETELFSPRCLDPAMAVQWSLDGEVTPL